MLHADASFNSFNNWLIDLLPRSFSKRLCHSKLFHPSASVGTAPSCQGHLHLKGLFHACSNITPYLNMAPRLQKHSKNPQSMPTNRFFLGLTNDLHSVSRRTTSLGQSQSLELDSSVAAEPPTIRCNSLSNSASLPETSDNSDKCLPNSFGQGAAVRFWRFDVFFDLRHCEELIDQVSTYLQRNVLNMNLARSCQSRSFVRANPEKPKVEDPW